MAKTGPKPKTLKTAYQTLLSQRVIDPETDCWLITKGHSVGIGYKRIRADHKDWYIHILSYTLNKGEVTPGNCICHSCDTPNCFNPDHLWEGTHSDNANDKHAKGRVPKGSSHYKSVLTVSAVKFIRENPQLNLGQLSRKFGVSRSSIKAAREYKTWKHVE